MLIRQDYDSKSTIIYIIILTIIFLITSSIVYKFLSKLTGSNEPFKFIMFILSSIYVIFLLIYLFNWSFENVFIIFLMISILISFVLGIMIYYGNDICEELGEKTQNEKNNLMKVIFFMIAFGVISLAVMNSSSAAFDLYDTIRFIGMLFLIRILYFICAKYNFPLLKTIVDIIFVYVIYTFLKKMYSLRKNIY